MDTLLSQLVLGLMRMFYHSKLLAAGVPLNPATRTAAQQSAAAMAAWAVTSEVKLQAESIAQSALES